MRMRWIAASVALAAVLGLSAAQAREPIIVLTGGASGVYYPLGVTLAKIFADIPDSRVEVQTTDGSVENLMRLQQGTGQIAFALGDALQDAWKGEADSGFSGKLDKLRVIGALYPSFIQIVATKDSGIRALTDLKGKSLSIGAEKSGTELNARAILKAAGIRESELGRIENKSFGESTQLMVKKQLDATLQSAGLGVTSLKELSDNNEIVLVPVPKTVVAKMTAPFKAGVIPADTYFGQDKPVPTAMVMNYLVTSAAVSDDLAYQMTKLVFDSLPELAVAHMVGSEIRRETAAKAGPVPLHPGAIRYYKEKGLLK
jgi:TRAP transporter TAXI family solute receptor